MAQLTSKFGVTLMDSREDLTQGFLRPMFHFCAQISILWSDHIFCANPNFVPKPVSWSHLLCISQFCAPISWVNPNLRYIHDECYGVALDSEGNYLIIGGWDIFPSVYANVRGLVTNLATRWCHLDLSTPICFRSGDEYEYEETNADGWSSDTWVRLSKQLSCQLCDTYFKF